MTHTIINTVVTVITSTLLGYCFNAIKHYREESEKEKGKERENESIQNQALLMLLQNNLTNTYFVYSEIGEIPDYIHKNWTNLAKIYKQLGGNDYIHVLEDKMKDWKIVKTDILK